MPRLGRRPTAGGLPVSLVAGLAITAFLVVITADVTRDAQRGAQPRRAQLIGLIQERQQELERLGSDRRTLSRRATAVEETLSLAGQEQAAELNAARLAAGLVPVRGDGVVVTLDDSSLSGSRLAGSRALRILDVDLQLATNALWAAGAEAISVNGSRLISTTSIRSAGETITVNFRPLTPPYEVRAVGADADAFLVSPVATRLAAWVDLFGFGFDVDERGDVEVPGFSGSTRLGAARATGG